MTDTAETDPSPPHLGDGGADVGPGLRERVGERQEDEAGPGAGVPVTSLPAGVQPQHGERRQSVQGGAAGQLAGPVRGRE